MNGELLTSVAAAMYLDISIQELHSYDKILSYTMQGFVRYYKLNDLMLFKEKLAEIKEGRI